MRSGLRCTEVSTVKGYFKEGYTAKEISEHMNVTISAIECYAPKPKPAKKKAVKKATTSDE